MQKSLLISAALFGAVAVISGAFGAHRLKDSLTPDQLSTYETAVKYLFYHVFAIIAAALLYDKTGSNLSLYAGLAFILGIILFSGSLFLLSTKSIIGIESWGWLGPITPIGGLAFIIGWGMLLISVFHIK